MNTQHQNHRFEQTAAELLGEIINFAGQNFALDPIFVKIQNS